MQWRWRGVKTDIYIKLVISFACAYFIYSSIVEYRYNMLIDRGLKTLQSIHKKNADLDDYTSGFIRAETDFKKAILFKHNRDEAYYYLATLYLDYINNDFEKKLMVTESTGLTEDTAEREAIAELERSISINPYNADAYFSLAWLYEYTGRREESDRLVERAEMLWPEKLRIKQKLLEWAVLRGNMLRVRELINDIYNTNTGMLSYSLNVVWRVEQDYEKIKMLVPETKKAREIFARFLRSKGMINEAMAEEEYAKTLE